MRISDWSSDVCSSDLLVPEQLAFDQCLGHRGAVHDHIGPVPARRQAVQALGDQFLARPAFADHQHRAVERGREARAFDRVLKRSEEHTSELQSLMRSSYAVFCLKKKKINNIT